VELQTTFAIVGGIEAESLRDSAKSTSGGFWAPDTADWDNGAIWSGGRVLYWYPEEKNAELTLQLPCPAGGEFEIVARMVTGPGLGTAQFLIEGKPAGDPIDLFAPKMAPREVSLGTFTLRPGANPIVVKVTGKNPLSKGIEVAIDAFMLRPPR
jgi:hypothetical protein